MFWDQYPGVPSAKAMLVAAAMGHKLRQRRPEVVAQPWPRRQMLHGRGYKSPASQAAWRHRRTPAGFLLQPELANPCSLTVHNTLQRADLSHYCRIDTSVPW